MIYRLIRCNRCGYLSIHTGIKTYICPKCGHRGRLSGLVTIYKSNDLSVVLRVLNSKQPGGVNWKKFRRVGYV